MYSVWSRLVSFKVMKGEPASSVEQALHGGSELCSCWAGHFPWHTQVMVGLESDPPSVLSSGTVISSGDMRGGGVGLKGVWVSGKFT